MSDHETDLCEFVAADETGTVWFGATEREVVDGLVNNLKPTGAIGVYRRFSIYEQRWVKK